MNKKHFTEEERKEAKKIKRKEYYQIHKTEELKYYHQNKKEILKKRKIYRQLRKEENKKYGKEYRATHKKEHAEKEKIRRNNNLDYRISSNLRTRLGIAIKNNQKSGSAVKDLGCSIPELKTHLESKFQKGMSWENWSIYGWHIDHIKPLSSFNLSDKKEFLKACHYTNLQPLWAEENLKKNNKILIKS